MNRFFLAIIVVGLTLTLAEVGMSQPVDKRALLLQESFWDNKDWDWYEANIPFLDCPDRELQTTYYYRWELLTKHLVYGSPVHGYTYTEFIDRPFWSGTYGSISCPAGHQLYEARWLRDRRYSQDYARYWFRVPGAQPRRYSTWLADSVWAMHSVQDAPEFVLELLPDLQANFDGWKQSHFVPEVGMFWQTGHDDGMEYNINSRQTQDILRGAPSYRPTINAYMYADALALAKMYELQGDKASAEKATAFAAQLKALVQERLWDQHRQFFFPMFKQNEERDGYVSKAMTLTYQTGKYAGSRHGRELSGYVPWQFNLPDDKAEYAEAWRYLNDPEYFAAEFGPSFVERHDPQFLVTKSCCWWSGQSWPYATTQTLVAMANLLNNYEQQVVNSADYYSVLRTYALTHRKDGRPYLAEACDPDTGSWEGYDGYNHSEHYFHSGFCDLVITGLAGLRPSVESKVTFNPLFPREWDHFAMVDLPYHGHLVSLIWDRTGNNYQSGAGLSLLIDGEVMARRDDVGMISAELGVSEARENSQLLRRVNFAVNNDGGYYPAIKASYSAPGTAPQKLVDGNYWYHVSPPNRWTTAGSRSDFDWLELDLGTERTVDELVLHVLDDERGISPPVGIRLFLKRNDVWKEVPFTRQMPTDLKGKRANYLHFDSLQAREFRIELVNVGEDRVGLAELGLWGPRGEGSITPPPAPTSLATNHGKKYPQISASHTSRFDRVENANDGVINYLPNPNNRWTAYESKSDSDWLEIDFGQPTTIGRVELHLYDDRGGVQAPRSYSIQVWSGKEWKELDQIDKNPEKPMGGTANVATFPAEQTTKLRIMFEHAEPAKSGVTEVHIWED